MEKAKLEKVQRTVAKLTQFYVGDRVIIISDETGRTMNKKDPNYERSWNANRGLKGVHATIVEIECGTNPTGYFLSAPGTTLNPNNIWAEGTFIKDTTK